MPGVVLAYMSVHQLFQLGLAAEEIGGLTRLYCSMVDLPGKWGKLLGRVVKTNLLRPMGAELLPLDKVREIPLPMLARQACHRAMRVERSDYYWSSLWFDRLAASRLAKEENARVHVGVETCALAALKMARSRGVTGVLDCPGIAAPFLSEQIGIAADVLGVDCPTPGRSERMLARKAEEMECADVVMVCSQMQRDYYIAKGMPAAKLRVNPLWVDEAFVANDQPRAVSEHDGRHGKGKLKVLFSGKATVGKGAPWAMMAMELLGDKAELTFVGGTDDVFRNWAGERLAKHKVLDWVPRADLKAVYEAHDVLLFPTLGDSFGFVGMEAMACGLPVVTTVNAGLPVPDESWKVQPRDAEALASRLLEYARQRDRLAADSQRAREFVKGFTAASYRQRAGAIFSELLKGGR